MLDSMNTSLGKGMVTKLGSDIIHNLLENPANKLGWRQLSTQQQQAMHGWAAAHQLQGRPFNTRYSVLQTSNGPKYFDWSDYPGS